MLTTVDHLYNRLSWRDVDALMRTREPACVTITMPTERAGRETRQNAIRYKNLLKQAETQLIEMELSDSQIQNLLAPAYDILKEREFWQHQSDGLAIFIDRSGVQSFRLAADFDEAVYVSDRFVIKPLLPLLTSNGHFYVLALSQNSVRMLHGTRFSVDQMTLNDDVPDSVDAMIASEGVGGWRQIHFRTVTGDNAAGEGGHHSVAYVVEEEKEKRILEFFRMVDDGVYDILHDDNAPLILAGVEWLHPLYRRANTYRHIAEEGITGNPEAMSDDDLHQEAWAIVEPMFAAAQAEAAEHFRAREHGDTATRDLREAVRAAEYGRIDTLFLPRDTQVWGTFEDGTVLIEDEQKPDNVDLLDFAAVRTLEQSGTVYVVDDVPGEGTVAALFRY